MAPLPSRLSWPKPRRGGALVRSLRALWTLPTNLIGHVAGMIVSGRRPRRIAGPAAVGWLYPIRSGIGLDWVSAVTLGHVILHRPSVFDGLEGRAVLAHELAHTRQHDLLGPAYLPLHILAQTTSALLSFILPGRVGSRVHAYNPLEHTFICLGAQACHDLAALKRLPEPEVEGYLQLFGV